MASIAISLLPLVPLAIWALLTGWTPGKTEGDILVVVPISLLARVKMIATPMVAGLLVILGITMISDFSWLAVWILTGVFVALISIPIGYTLTTTGIRIGKGQFRRWTEFAGVRRSPSGVVLVGGQRASSYPIFLGGDRGDDEFVLTLKNLILDSYKGTTTVRKRLQGEESPD